MTPEIPEAVEIPEPGKAPMTHVAGPCLTLFGRYMRQRCSWCGAVLLEYDLSRVAVPVGQDPTPASWPVGEQIYVDNSAVPHVGYVVKTETNDDGTEAKIAEDSCMGNPLTLLSFM